MESDNADRRRRAIPWTGGGVLVVDDDQFVAGHRSLCRHDESETQTTRHADDNDVDRLKIGTRSYTRQSSQSVALGPACCRGAHFNRGNADKKAPTSSVAASPPYQR